MLAVALLLICFLFSGVVVNLIIGAAGYSQFTEMVATAEGRMLYRVLSGLSGLISWALPAFLWAVYLGGFKSQLGLDSPSPRLLKVLAMLIPVFMLPLASTLIIPSDWDLFPKGMEAIEQWATKQESTVSTTIVSLLSEDSIGLLLLNVVVIAVVPAIAEEMLFRGVLLNVFGRLMPVHAAVWLGAAIFSLVHFQVFGFFARMALGALLGYLYVGSGDLRTSMWAHFAHNLSSLVIVVLAVKGILPQTLLTDRLVFGVAPTLVSALVAFGLLYVYFRRVSNLKPLDLHE